MPVGKSSLMRAGKSAAGTVVSLPETRLVNVPVASVLATPKGFLKDTRGDNFHLVTRFGVTEPLLLLSKEGELYLLRGANTLSACKKCGVTEVPGYVLTLTEEEAKALCKEINRETPVVQQEKTGMEKEEKEAQEKPLNSIHEQKFNVIRQLKEDLPFYLM